MGNKDMAHAQQLALRNGLHLAEIEQKRTPGESEIDIQTWIAEGVVDQGRFDERNQAVTQPFAVAERTKNTSPSWLAAAGRRSPSGLVPGLRSKSVRPRRSRVEHRTRELVRVARQVVNGKQSDERVVAVENRQASQMLFFHHSGGFGAMLVFETRSDITGHDVAYRNGRRILCSTDASATDVAIGDDPNWFPVLRYYEGADTELIHFMGALP